tara:strand:+ start:433 stop:642 length:210 start_codon:yes stop_codon:yes gene_type:complete
MKAITLIICIFALSSCGRTITEKDLIIFYAACQEKQGVYRLEILDTNEHIAHCKNGESFNIERQKRPFQ